MSALTASAPKTKSPMRWTELPFAAAVFSPVKNVCSHCSTYPHAPPLDAVLPEASKT
jgi:hypothetical protein